MNLSNKNILITGASSGIGFELAKQLSANHSNLILLARRKEILDDLAKKIKKDNIILTYKCDVRNKQEVKNVFSDIRKQIERIDIGILNAGVNNRMNIRDYNSDLADDTFQVNFLGMIYCIEELLKDFIPRKSGIIAGVSSIADVRGFPKSGLYGASKAAVSVYLESIRNELRSSNIKIITIRPGFVVTPMTDPNKFKMPFLMNVEKAVKIIMNGLEKEKKVIEFPLGTVLGGKLLKILPNFIFDYLALKGLPEDTTKS
jgi:short-subunit dehydrogenase